MAKLKRTVIVGGLSGSSGPVTFRMTREGTIVGERTSPRNPNTPGQQAARARLTTVSRIYKNFTQAQEQAWEQYAQALPETDEVTGKSSTPTAINAFAALSTKFLQVNPGGTVPLSPPTAVYNGDPVTVTAEAGTGDIRFAASGPNSANTKTEILLQRLASRNRNPQKGAYKSAGFYTFTSGSLFVDIEVSPGWWAAAYRFVNTATGQTTKLQPIPVQQVTLGVAKGGTSAKKKAA